MLELLHQRLAIREQCTLKSVWRSFYLLWKRFYWYVFNIWVKIFKNGPGKICERQPLKNLKWCALLRQALSLQVFQRLSSTNFTWSILEYLDPLKLNTGLPKKLWQHNLMSCRIRFSQTRTFKGVWLGQKHVEEKEILCFVRFSIVCCFIVYKLFFWHRRTKYMFYYICIKSNVEIPQIGAFKLPS